LPAVVLAHGGISSPTPYTPVCSGILTGQCGTGTGPCGGLTRPATATNVLSTDTTVTLQFLVVAAHANVNNTCTLSYYQSASDSAHSCGSSVCNVGAVSTDGTTITCTCNVALAVFTSTGFISAFFDATPGGGTTYYSCMAVSSGSINFGTTCTAPTPNTLTFCPWYSPSTCCGSSTSGNAFSETRASGDYDAYTTVCLFGGCSQGCKDFLKLVACKYCAPKNNDAPICLELCQKMQSSCSGSLFSSLVSTIAGASDCSSLQPASSGTCFNSGAQVAVSVVAMAIMAALALLL